MGTVKQHGVNFEFSIGEGCEAIVESVYLMSVPDFGSVDLGAVTHLFLEKYVPWALHNCNKDEFFS